MGITNFWRNIWLSTASTLVMILTLLSFSLIIILNILGNSAIQNIKDKIDVSLYLKKDLSENQILSLKGDIQRINGVIEVTYISSAQALENFQEKHKDDKMIAGILKEFNNNPLEAILIIKAANPEQYPNIMSRLDEARFQDLIRKINYKDNQPMIRRITATANSLEKAGIVISIIFASIAVLVMFNTVRLTIYSRSHEIEIMKLVGATNWYVRSPMIIEGILYGIFASIISLAILFPVVNIISPKIENYFQGYSLNLAQYFSIHLFEIIGLQILVGVLLGAISSGIAVRKYLNK